MSICHSFPVHTVHTDPERLPEAPRESLRAAISTLGTPISVSTPDSDVPVTTFFHRPSLFAVSVYESFCRHCPLKLNPNVVWLTILQGFATYVSRNAQLLRGKFVTHPDRETIQIYRPDFHYGSPLNDWASTFPQFADELDARISPGIRT